MQKAIKVKASIKGGKIEVPASIGATVVRVVGPPIYRGATVVTPSDSEQVLPTKDKLVREDITVNPAPTEPLSTTENGQFTPSDGHVGFSQVNVDVQPELTSLSVTENGLYLPESGVDGFDRVNVNVPQPSGSTTITQNGTYNVEQYASAVVDVPDQYLIAEGVEDTTRNDIFCKYWTEKYVPVRDETRYIYIIQVENNAAGTGIQWLFYNLRNDSDNVVAIRVNPYRLIDNVKALDTNLYNLFVSAGATVKVYRIPKTAT